MNFTDRIETVDTHTEGQPTRIVTGGVPPLAGRTMVEKLDDFRKRFDCLRTRLLAEPRGHRDMYGAVLTDAVGRGDFGVFFMHNEGYMEMCGHATIGLGAALVDRGLVEASEPETHVALDTPAGPVELNVALWDGRAQEVRFRNVAAFCEHVEADLELPGTGRIQVDVAWGGNYFVFFEASAVGVPVESDNLEEIIRVGLQVRDAANAQLSVSRLGAAAGHAINIATIQTPGNKGGATRFLNVHVFGDGQWDRSPGGTGTSARLAVLSARGRLGPGDGIEIDSLTGGRFQGRILEVMETAGRPAVVTEVSGRAHVTGVHEFVADPEDPLADGFLLA